MIKASFLATIALGVGLTAAPAALTLMVDPGVRGLTLSGTDTGFGNQVSVTYSSGERNDNAGSIIWELTGLGGPAVGSGVEGVDLGLFTIGSAESINQSIGSTLNQAGSGIIYLRLLVSDSGQISIAGTGTQLNFTGFTEGVFSRFVNAHGQIIPLQTGSGFSAIEVIVIPEPSAFALMCLGACPWFIRRRARTSFSSSDIGLVQRVSFSPLTAAMRSRRS